VSFTDYVRSLASGREPDAVGYEALRQALGGALRHEIQARGLWGAPPWYLGVHGGTSWEDEDLFDELVGDCSVYIFVRRLPGV
jgi:hypothetical protein